MTTRSGWLGTTIAFDTNRKILLAILLLALALRVSGLFWGLPIFDPYAQPYHPDENRLIAATYGFPGDILGRTDLRYPTLTAYAAGLIALPIKAVGTLFSMPEAEKATATFVLARLLTLALGLGSILLTFLLGRRLYDARAGLLAAALVAVAPYHVQCSAFATTDVPSSFFMLLALLAALRLYDHHALKDFALAGVAAGLLVGTRYTGGIVALPLLIVVVSIWMEHRNVRSLGHLLLGLLVLGITSVAVFLLVSPGVVLHPRDFFDSIAFVRSEYATIALSRLDPQSWRTVWHAFVKAFGLPMLAFCIAGTVLAVARRRPRGIIPIVVMLTAFVLIYANNALEPRYLVMILPVICVLAAGGIRRLFDLRTKPVRVAVFAVTIIVVGSGLATDILNIGPRLSDTRSQAAAFIARMIPPGSTIGADTIGNHTCWRWALPMIDRTKFRVVDALEKPDFVVLSSEGTCSGQIIDMLRSPRLSEGYVISDPDLKKTWKHWQQVPRPEVLRFYDDVVFGKGTKYRYSLVRHFRHDRMNFMEYPPPEILIFIRDDLLRPKRSMDAMDEPAPPPASRP